MKKPLLAIFACALPFIILAQAPGPVITGGPLSGSVNENSAKVWLSYRGNGQVEVNLFDSLSHLSIPAYGFQRLANAKGDTSLISEFKGLTAGHRYVVQHHFTGKNIPDCAFSTQSKAGSSDIDFLFGSCALACTGFWRMFWPGADIRIYKHMLAARPDFMVWLGDNLYYLGSDFKSYEHMFRRNLDVRGKFPLMRKFLAAQPNYAIWDDHDYGPNDSDKRFLLKDTALKIFRAFWPNTYETEVRENYFTYRYADAEFFMTDDRYFRDGPEDSLGDYLGPAQLKWLEAKLLASNASFKFICTGSQVINDNEHGETYARYPRERNNLLDFIAGNNIRGVIFLTGDKHYSELSERVWHGYPFYDFTSSPITSPILPRKGLNAFNNPYSVQGSVLYRKNFGRIRINGAPGHRVCQMQLYGKNGRLRFNYSVKADDICQKEVVSKK